MFERSMTQVLLTVGAVLLVGVVGVFLLAPDGLDSPSNDALASAFGGACDLPSASCSLSNGCVSGPLTSIYYDYSGLNHYGADDDMGTIRCFTQKLYSFPNCSGDNTPNFWFVC